MILIISSQTDQTTNEVLYWLNFFNKNFIRLNEEDIITDYHYINGNIIFKTNTKKIVDLSKITSYWYRRGGLRLMININDEYSSNSLKENIYSFKKQESKKIIDFIYKVLDLKKSITSVFSIEPNKLYILELAEKCGLKIPHTTISSDSNILINFINSNQQTITKPIGELMAHTENGKTFKTYTSDITIDQLVNDTRIFPSLLQEKIEKKYELRIFFFNDTCHTMAIFSQKDEQTQTDFRRYNHGKPNRRVPFILPDEIKQKLCTLMRKLHLKSGSIDMIVNLKNEFIFLEVNPIGQFGMVSYPCNYSLEKKVAQFLTNNEK